MRPFIWLVPGSLSGGERRKSEKARLRKGVTVLVCTPGRLLDHLKTTKCFRRDSLRWLILDEADRLLDMGFEKQVLVVCRLVSLGVGKDGAPALCVQTIGPRVLGVESRRSPAV